MQQTCLKQMHAVISTHEHAWSYRGPARAQHIQTRICQFNMASPHCSNLQPSPAPTLEMVQLNVHKLPLLSADTCMTPNCALPGLQSSSVHASTEGLQATSFPLLPPTSSPAFSQCLHQFLPCYGILAESPSGPRTPRSPAMRSLRYLRGSRLSPGRLRRVAGAL